jgi:hypothetical protein
MYDEYTSIIFGTIFYSQFLSENVKIKIHQTIILSVDLYGMKLGLWN